VADEVFAKTGLAEHCRARGLRCEEMRSFDDVRRSLEARRPTA
jgi:2-hydroxy-3-keto-5-methylthiopentenyl-1-phosphate phosphatase